jgi:galactokinase
MCVVVFWRPGRQKTTTHVYSLEINEVALPVFERLLPARQQRNGMIDLNAIRNAFEVRFKQQPHLLVRAPGRVNLIGDHTDYNEGFVLPMAIDQATYVAARTRPDRTIHSYSTEYSEDDMFTLDRVERSTERPWSNYIRGVARGLIARDLTITGANLLIASSVPPGRGLSSSAALEVAVGYAFQLLNQHDLLGEELALLAQGAEQSFIGVQCGIMDQLTAVMGQTDHGLLIDCRDLSYHPIPIPPDVRIVVCDSGIQHTLTNTAYNQRRAECTAAVRMIKQQRPLVSALRDIQPDDLADLATDLPDVLLRRTRHVVSENQRTLAAADALNHGDLVGFGALMNASHASLRDDYESSLPEIDILAEIAQTVPGCYGSRITGGGFGGSTVSLVTVSAVDTFRETVTATYRARTGLETSILVCRGSSGVSRARPDQI